jgi:hypothetical protein
MSNDSVQRTPPAAHEIPALRLEADAVILGLDIAGLVAAIIKSELDAQSERISHRILG